MKKIFSYILILAASVLMVACQQDSFEPAEMLVKQPDAASIAGELNGYDYTVRWTGVPADYYMMYSIYLGGSQVQGFTVDADRKGEFTIPQVETFEQYEFVFKYCTTTDGSGPISKGTVITYTRPGAPKATNVALAQQEYDGGNKVIVTWDANELTTAYDVTVTVTDKRSGELKDTKTVTGQTECRLEFEGNYGEVWKAAVTAYNADGRAIPAENELLIGKTRNAFLSNYATEADLLANGDDDEACAWLLLHDMFPAMEYLYFGNVTADRLEPLRMCFYIRDIETGNADDIWAHPAAALAAAPAVEDWVAEGGNLCLWSHATAYACAIHRFNESDFRSVDNAIGTGAGGQNGDVWKMGATIKTEKGFVKDNGGHPLFKNMRTEKNDAGITLIPLKGAGWTEDHNCLWFNLPAMWTGFENTSADCYNALVTYHGVRPIGIWDSQSSWISQLNVWEAFRADEPATAGGAMWGTILCVGNGACEISLKNADGTADLTMSVNSEQDNINQMVRNAVDYLMSK